MPDIPDVPEARLRHLTERAERLVADIAEQADRDSRIDRAAFAEGYRLGFVSGREVGYRQAEEEKARDWARIRVRVRNIARTPTFAELQKRRTEAPK